MKTRLIFHTAFTFLVVLFCLSVIPIMWIIGENRVEMWIKMFMTVLAIIATFAYGFVLVNNIKQIRTLK